MAADHMEALKARFRLRCQDDLQLLKTLREDPQSDLAVEFGVRVHRLAGLAGALGHDALGDIARIVDDALSQDRPASGADLDRLQAALEAVAALA